MNGSLLLASQARQSKLKLATVVVVRMTDVSKMATKMLNFREAAGHDRLLMAVCRRIGR